jgi:hypothetical protein
MGSAFIAEAQRRGGRRGERRPWVFAIVWGSPYTNPPAEQPRVLMSVVRWQVSGHPVPEDITLKYAEIGFGTGWALSVSIDPEFTEQQRLARQFSPERKAALRKGNLRRRVEKRAPLFAEEIIQRELARDPSYYNAEVAYVR